jgi:hypothetical protein
LRAKKRFPKTCAQCGVDFVVKGYEVETRKHCSKKCHNDSMTRPTARYRGQSGGHKAEHIRVAEAALGKSMPDEAVVHHVNNDGLDNRNQNLVICQDNSYHRLLHVRERVVRAGGNPNTQRICPTCKVVLYFSEFGAFKFGGGGSQRRECKSCARNRQEVRRKTQSFLSRWERVIKSIEL